MKTINLKQILKKYDMTQKELAALYNVTKAAASQYVSGEVNVSLEKTIILAKHLNIPIDELINDNKNTITFIKDEDYKKIRLHQKAIEEIMKKYDK